MPASDPDEVDFLRARLQGAEAFIAWLLVDREELLAELAETMRELQRLNVELLHVNPERLDHAISAAA